MNPLPAPPLAPPSKTKKRKTDFHFAIEQEAKKRFDEAAKAEGKKPSEKIRELMMAYLDSKRDSITVEPDPAKSKLINIRTLLPEFLLEAVEDRAKQKGMSRNRWLSALAQSNLMRLPVLLDKELDALQTTSREMVAIGRNLNQIARVLNSDPNRAATTSLQEIQILSATLKEIRTEIHNLVTARNNAWVADE